MSASDKDPPSLEELQQRIDRIKPQGSESSQPEGARSYAKAMKAATELFAGAGVGCAIGYGLDHWLDSSPIGLIMFFFIGFAAGVRNIIRNAEQM
jgi:ATP synthase protein I